MRGREYFPSSRSSQKPFFLVYYGIVPNVNNFRTSLYSNLSRTTYVGRYKVLVIISNLEISAK